MKCKVTLIVAADERMQVKKFTHMLESKFPTEGIFMECYPVVVNAVECIEVPKEE